MPVLDTSAIVSAAARDCLWRFRLNHEANREFYRRVPAEQYDERLVDAMTRRSDSPRESLLHQLYVLRNYVYSVRTGVMQWGPERERLLVMPALERWDKRRLLEELDKAEQALVELLARPDIEWRGVRVAWRAQPVPALRLLRGLIDHEILQASWNQTLARRLEVERYPALARFRG